MKTSVVNMVFGVAASLPCAQSAIATSIVLQSCKDQATGETVVFYDDLQNGQRLFYATDAKDQMAVVLADCSNGFALQVRDRKNWCYGDSGSGVTLYDRPGLVRAYLADAVRSPEPHSWEDLRPSLTRDGYLVQTGELSSSYCGCAMG